VDALGHSGHGSDGHPGVQDGYIEGPEARAIRVIGVWDRNLLWKKGGVGNLNAVPATLIGSASNILQLGRINHKRVKSKPHKSSPLCIAYQDDEGYHMVDLIKPVILFLCDSMGSLQSL
jgi:hypothetical protein